MRTIQGKMFIAFSVVICLAIVPIAYSAYWNSSKVIERNAIAYISERISSANNDLQAMIEDADKISKVIVSNKDNVQNSILSGTEAPSYEWFMEKKAMEDFLSSMAAYKPFIERITVAGTNGKLYQTGNRRIDPGVIEMLKSEPSLMQNKKHLRFDSSVEGKIMLIRPISSGSQVIGYCIVEFDRGIVQKVFDIEPLADSMVAVLDEFCNIMYHTNPEFIRRQAGETSLGQIIQSKSTGFENKLVIVDGTSYLTVQFSSEFTGWTTVGMVPLRSLLSEVHNIRDQIFTIAVIVLITVLLVSILLSNQITRNIKRLRNAMRLVREGHLNARPRIRSNDEVGQLSEMFDSMMSRLQDLMNETQTRERQKREAEYKALQAQIKPHFLYNTLNTIKYLAGIQHARNIEEISESLIEIMRFAIDPSREMITIREELDQVKRYLSIQKFKFLDRLTVIADTEESVLDCLIPKLTLQPVVENALHHGLGGSGVDGTVTIRIYGEGMERVKLDVTDNGAGISEEQIADILSGRARTGEAQSPSNSGIGLKNVNERIKFAFGDMYGLSLYSQPGVFTTVELTVPQQRRLV
ncbi:MULTISPECIES: cache domain-containing sensor histidine kinase [unclassified Paenibacillus]|uniref:cache domain-containing sensor histidine kinase n=1 Tax=unclassified Paenibacillus TaxID=185978 RepID=UPI00363B3B9D